MPLGHSSREVARLFGFEMLYLRMFHAPESWYTVTTLRLSRATPFKTSEIWVEPSESTLKTFGYAVPSLSPVFEILHALTQSPVLQPTTARSLHRTQPWGLSH